MNYPEILPSSVLHWNYRGLTEFPIQQLRGEETEVTDIYLKENLLTRIPNEIGMLVHLESLYISGNDITELPKDIANLKCLKCLDVSGNRLKSIPNEIGEVMNLKFLILDENELCELPLRIAELRYLRYLSVCDNKLKWLPQRPVYNYHHCEFRFWRNSNLRSLPYSLWYHMFRNQQTRSINIACLNSSSNRYTQSQGNKCRLKLSQGSREWEFEVDCPPHYNVIQETKTNSPPSLYELSKRLVYQRISEAAKKISTDAYSIYSEAKLYTHSENNNVTNLHNNFSNINIKTNGNTQENIKIRRKDYFVPKDIIDDDLIAVPNFIKEELINGPVSRCENANCRRPVFDHVYYEFTFGNIILIDNVQEVVLSAAFCSKTCADIWRENRITTIPWTLARDG